MLKDSAIINLYYCIIIYTVIIIVVIIHTIIIVIIILLNYSFAMNSIVKRILNHPRQFEI